jgi:hypothetical protein
MIREVRMPGFQWECECGDIGPIYPDRYAAVLAYDRHLRTNKTPQVGMLGTEYVGSDRYPLTIVRISKSGTTLWFKRHSNSEPTKAKRYPDNKWRLPNRGNWLHIGHAEGYRDPSY